MPFPISIRGSVTIGDEAANVSDDAIIIACVDQIEHEGARVISHSDQSLVFSVPFFSWGWNWRFTCPLAGGSLAITTEPTGDRRLSYDFSTRRLALIGTLVIGGFFTVVAVQVVGQSIWWIAPAAWLWMIGPSYFISFVRASRWVRRRVSVAVKAAGRAPAP
ncbi:MAG: hypothetical protein ACJ796_10060 [Gemmatimonadaceae bacterium]